MCFTDSVYVALDCIFLFFFCFIPLVLFYRIIKIDNDLLCCGSTVHMKFDPAGFIDVCDRCDDVIKS